MKKLSKILLAISFVLSLTTSAFATTVTAVSWGGAYTESQKLGYGDPTAKKLGIKVINPTHITKDLIIKIQELKPDLIVSAYYRKIWCKTFYDC